MERATSRAAASTKRRSAEHLRARRANGQKNYQRLFNRGTKIGGEAKSPSLYIPGHEASRPARKLHYSGLQPVDLS